MIKNMSDNCDNKILRDEALRRIKKESIFHSAGIGGYKGLASGGASMTYKERQEMRRKYVGKYDDSQIGQSRNPLQRATAVQPTAEDGSRPSRFDAKITKRAQAAAKAPRQGLKKS